MESQVSNVTDLQGIINANPDLLSQPELVLQLLKNISFDEFFNEIYNHPLIYYKLSTMNTFWFKFLDDRDYLLLITKYIEKDKQIDSKDDVTLNKDEININWFYETISLLFTSYADYYFSIEKNLLSATIKNFMVLQRYKFPKFDEDRKLQYSNIKDMIFGDAYFYILFKDGNVIYRKDTDKIVYPKFLNVYSYQSSKKSFDVHFLANIKQIYKLNHYNLFLSYDGILSCVYEHKTDEISVVPFPFKIKSLLNPVERINETVSSVLVLDYNDNLYFVPYTEYIFEKINPEIFNYILDHPLLRSEKCITPILFYHNIPSQRFLDTFNKDDVGNIKYIKENPFEIILYYIGDDNRIHKRFYVNYILTEQGLTRIKDDIVVDYYNKCKSLVSITRKGRIEQEIYFVNTENVLGKISLSVHIINIFSTENVKQSFKYEHKIYFICEKGDKLTINSIDERRNALNFESEDINVNTNIIANDNFIGIILEIPKSNLHVYIPYALYLEYLYNKLVVTDIVKGEDIIFRVKNIPYIFQTSIPKT